MATYFAEQLLKFAHRTGRWVVKEIAGQAVLYTTNLGSTIRFITHGTDRLIMTVLDNGAPQMPSQVYAYRVDHRPWHRVPAREIHWSIPLPDQQPHQVEIMTAGNTDYDPVWQGNAGFAIVSICNSRGELTSAPPRPLVNFIGDSITAGCWVTGRHAAADYRPESNYVAIACDQLAVDGVRIAYSAGGVLRPATGGVPVASKFLPMIDQTTSWSVNRPDLVVVNLGVNDRRFPVNRFVLAYHNFIDQVVATFPHAPVVIMVPFSQTFHDQIIACAKEHQLAYLETGGWCTSFTDGLHPDQAGAQTAGQHLARALKPFLKTTGGSSNDHKTTIRY